MKQTKSRRQFTFYHSYIDAVMGLPKCRRFETLLGIIFYALDGTEPQLSGASEALFRAIKPNVDSSRLRAESALRAKETAQTAEADGEAARGPETARTGGRARSRPASGKGKQKEKHEIESESEKETEKENENEKEEESSALAADTVRRGAAETGADCLSLPAFEQRDWNNSLCGNAPSGEGVSIRPEARPVYAGMLNSDHCLRVFWDSWVNREQAGRLPSPAEKEALLKTLRAAPPQERIELLCARLRPGEDAGGGEGIRNK